MTNELPDGVELPSAVLVPPAASAGPPGSTPVAPFGATVAGALALLPDATLAVDAPAPGATPGTPRGLITREVTYDQAQAWAEQLSARVALKLDGWTRLPAVVDPLDDLVMLSDREYLVLEARRLVHDGLASYIEAARARASAGPTTETTSYAAVLWTRFEDGLADLIGWFVARLLGADPSTDPDSGAGARGLAIGHFPPPAFGRGTRF